MNIKPKYILRSICFLVITIFVLSGYEIVDTGYYGVRKTLGKIDDEPLPEGFYLKWPFITRIIEIEVRSIRKDDKTTAYTKDIQQAAIDYTINYHLDKTKVAYTYRTLGSDWEERAIPQITLGTLKEVIGKWNADELISSRDKAIIDIKEDLAAKLHGVNVILDNFEIKNIDYSDVYENAIETKVVATQRAIEAKNNTVKIEEEAKQRLISAKAEAESMRIRSEALAQNKSLVEYEAVQKWDGKLPQYMMGNAVPFVNIKTE